MAKNNQTTTNNQPKQAKQATTYSGMYAAIKEQAIDALQTMAEGEKKGSKKA